MTGEGPGAAEAGTRRRTIAIVVAVIVVILVVTGALVAAGFNDAAHRGAASGPSGQPSAASDTPSASATPQGDPSPDPSTAPTPTATVDPRFGAPVAQTVSKDATGDLGNTVSAKITRITSITATGTQAGEVSGPASQVELTITNGTSSEISLAGVTVNAYYGSAMPPASPIESRQAGTAFRGTLAAAKTATASYVFSVPKDQQASLVVTVSREAGAPIVVFQ